MFWNCMRDGIEPAWANGSAGRLLAYEAAARIGYLLFDRGRAWY
jgi:hypothetical protein